MILRTTNTLIWPVHGITAGAAVIAAILAVSVVLVGCDSASFVPPRPPELNEPVAPTITATYDGANRAATSSVPAPGKHESGGTRVVELILARPPDDDRIFFDTVLRRELGKVMIPLRLTKPDGKTRSSPEAHAAAIRAAVGRGAAGLVVEPSDEAAVIDALYDAVGRGVAILLLDRSVPARWQVDPTRRVHGVHRRGARIVAAVLEGDRDQKHAKPGRIVLLHHRTDDPYLQICYKSLLGPCQASGKPIEILEFAGDAEQGMASVRKSLEADPAIDILVADDALGVYVGFRIHIDLTDADRRPFVLAGYTSDDYRIVTFLDRMYAIGDRSVGSYSSKTSQAIRTLMEGKPVESVIEVPVTFSRRWMLPETPAKKPPPLRTGSNDG